MKILAWSFAIFVASVVFAADTNINPALFGCVNSIPGSDFTGHVFLMGTLSFLVNLAFGCRTHRVLGFRIYDGMAIVLAAVMIEEISQMWMPHRTCSWSDAGGDLIGIILFGGVLAPLVHGNRILHCPLRGQEDSAHETRY